MAAIEKFVRILAIPMPAFLPREKPISSRAKPCLHEEDEDRGHEDPGQVDAPGHVLRGHGVLGESGGREQESSEQCQWHGPCQSC
jgi:hypothetical protein